MTKLRSHQSVPDRNLECEILRADELDGELRSLWESFQLQSIEWESPFFHPAFTEAVAAVRDGVRIALLRSSGRTVGFFPFQAEGSRGEPVGHPVSDWHGLIHEPDLVFDAAELLRLAGLRSWSFDHAPASQRCLQDHRMASTESPFMDLGEGWEAYVREQKKQSSKVLASTLKKARKIGREIGEPRLVYDDPERSVFEKLIEWKARQQRETGAREVLREGWIVELLDRLRGTRCGSFRGVLSSLYAGDELLAAHLGMQNGGTLHMWFQTYNRAFARYSPGLVMLCAIGRSCEKEGIVRIDLGKGPEEYKGSFRSDALPLIEGSVDLSAPRRLLNLVRFRSKEWVRSSSLYPGVFAAKRFLRKNDPRKLLRSGG